jgi:hypothetical protein
MLFIIYCLFSIANVVRNACYGNSAGSSFFPGVQKKEKTYRRKLSDLTNSSIDQMGNAKKWGHTAGLTENCAQLIGSQLLIIFQHLAG